MGKGLDLRGPLVQEILNHLFVIQATISVVQLVTNIVHHLNMDIHYSTSSFLWV